MKRAMLLAAILVFGLGQAALAQGGNPAMLDKIVATVDDEVILLSAVLQDVELFLMQTGARVDSIQYRQLMEEALGNMVNEKILLAKARRDGIQIGEEELNMALDRHVAGLIEQSGGENRFQRQLDAEGMDRRDLRRRLGDPMRDQLMVQRVVETVTWDLEVGENEARAFFEENKGNEEIIPLRPRAVKLSHILVNARPAPEVETALRKDWRAALDRLAAGEEFAEVARAMSKGPAAALGGDLGWLGMGDIADPVIQEALVSLEPGQIDEEVMTEQGLHILKLDERNGNRVRIHQIVFPLTITEEDRQRARDRAREAHKVLVEGGAWDETVLEYSDDEYTRERGGSLPLIPVDQLEDRYRDIIELLEPGEYSPVFKGIRGYQIVKLDGREKPRPFEFDEIKDQLRAELLAQKRGETLESYIAELEDEVLVQRMGIPDADKMSSGGAASP